MLENFFQKLFDQSAAMQALRQSAKKATILGIAEGLGCNLTQAELESGVIPDQSMKGTSGTTEKPKSVQAIPLPQPLSLGHIGAKSTEVPDGPGVPPNRIRNKRRDKGGEQQGDVTMNGSPDANEEKGEVT